MNLLESIIICIITLWLGSMEYRMRQVTKEVDDKINHTEAKELIDLKQEVIKASVLDLKEDIQEVKRKLDVIDTYIRSR